jgi:PLP dependent protein
MTLSQDQLALVKEQIENAAIKAARRPSDVTLIAVSKNFDAEDVIPILESGQRVFGENRVQEAQKKWPELREKYPGIELHLIGPLQSNKVSEAVQLFDVIQTVDRPKLVLALAKEIQKQAAATKLLVQVNTGREPQKAGVLPEELGPFMDLCREQLASHVQGFMCIPPAQDNPRPHFKLLKSMAETYQLPLISMGMSSDFAVAIEEGATYVRVGSAIFGTRLKIVTS